MIPWELGVEVNNSRLWFKRETQDKDNAETQSAPEGSRIRMGRGESDELVNDYQRLR